MITINNTIPGFIKDIGVKGNTVQDPNNLSSITSCGINNGDGTYKMSILSVGENLFNKTKCVKGVITSNGSINPNDGWNVSDFIKVNPNMKCNKTTLSDICAFDINKEPIGMIANSMTTFTIPQNCYYIRCNVDNASLNTYKLQEGTQATPYTPYEETRCDINLPCQLEKWDKLYFDKDENAWCVEKKIITDAIYNLNWYDADPSNSQYKDFRAIPFDGKRLSGVRYIYTNVLPSFNSENELEVPGIILFAHANKNEIIARLPIGTTLEQWKATLLDNKAFMKYVSLTPQKIVLPKDTQIQLNSFADKTHIYTLSGEVDAIVKATVSKSLGATVQANTNELNILSSRVADIEGLKESQDFSYETDKGYLICKDTRNGVVKDMKIYGKSLVNVVKSYNNDRFTLLNATKDEDNYFTLKYGANVNATAIKVLHGTHLYEPNKKYTIVVDIKENNTGTKLGMSPILSPVVMPANISFDNETGISSRLITTSNNVNLDDKGKPCVLDLYFGIWKDGGDLSKHIKFRYWILEGDWTQKPPSYFEGIASVGTGADKIEVSSCTKISYTYSSSYGSRNDYTLSNVLVPGCSITNISDKSIVAQAYDATTQKWTRDDNILPTETYVIKEGEYCPIITLYTGRGWQLKEEKLERFISISTQKYETKPLLYKDTDGTWKPITTLPGYWEGNEFKWGDVVDNALNKWFKRTNTIVLNGSENIEGKYPFGTKTSAFYTNLNFAKVDDKSENIAEVRISDKFKSVKNYDMVNTLDEECFSINNGGRVIIRVDNSKLETQDIAGFKKWLQSNNVTIVYRLSQEKVYEVAPIDLESFEDETMISFDSGVINPPASWKITSYLPNFVMNLGKRVKRVEDDFYKYTVTQNRLMLTSRYSADSVTFKVDYSNSLKSASAGDEDLFNLIKANILAGKENYNYDDMIIIISDYVSWNQITWDQFDMLIAIMDQQHNPPMEEVLPDNTPEI